MTSRPCWESVNIDHAFALVSRSVIKFQEKYTSLSAFTLIENLHCNVSILLHTHKLGWIVSAAHARSAAS